VTGITDEGRRKNGLGSSVLASIEAIGLVSTLKQPFARTGASKLNYCLNNKIFLRPWPEGVPPYPGSQNNGPDTP